MSAFAKAKQAARVLGVDTRAVYHKLSRWSLQEGVREQGLSELVGKLRDLVPDLRDQFTQAFDEDEYLRYWEPKMRAQQAWQIDFVLKAVEWIGRSNLTVVDIGDSSGTHSRYLQSLAPSGRIGRCVGINLDAQAVQRIKRKGGEAILSRAEELDLHGVRADLFLCFETLEHLTDPVRFLHRLATEGSADHLVITVPYRRVSRFGGEHLRQSDAAMAARMTAEEVHIYEFSPEDWTLLLRFSGFRPITSDIYRQYARLSISRLVAPLWSKLDYEGFFAIFAERDLSLARRYADW